MAHHIQRVPDSGGPGPFILAMPGGLTSLPSGVDRRINPRRNQNEGRDRCPDPRRAAAVRPPSVGFLPPGIERGPERTSGPLRREADYRAGRGPHGVSVGAAPSAALSGTMTWVAIPWEYARPILPLESIVGAASAAPSGTGTWFTIPWEYARPILPLESIVAAGCSANSRHLVVTAPDRKVVDRRRDRPDKGKETSGDDRHLVVAAPDRKVVDR